MAVKLFVGGLSFSTSNERLREVFAATLSRGRVVVTDRDTGGCVASASSNGDAGGRRTGRSAS